MCVIICIENGHLPSLETLKSAESLNSDGAGIAFPKNGKIYYKKGLELKAEEIHAILKENKPKTAIIHFRIKSSGEKISELNHPFPISAQAELDLEGFTERALFHNGTWYSYDDKLATGFFAGVIKEIPDGPFSDSRGMAVLAHYYGPSFFRLLQNQRIAILDKSGIHRFGEWVKVKGNQCSNDHFIKPKEEKSNKWENWCTEHNVWNCPMVTHKAKTPLPLSKKIDYDSEIELLWYQYSNERDNKKANVIMGEIQRLEDERDNLKIDSDFDNFKTPSSYDNYPGMY